jgi:hypothetical protein
MYGMERKINKNWTEVAGYIGMILVHAAIIPTTVMNIMGWSDKLPPLSMVLLIQLGLALFLIRAIANKDTLYTISNGFGFVTQTILLAIIVFK